MEVVFKYDFNHFWNAKETKFAAGEVYSPVSKEEEQFFSKIPHLVEIKKKNRK